MRTFLGLQSPFMNFNTMNTHQGTQKSTIAIYTLLITVLILTVLWGSSFAQGSGYGYGYGEDQTCEANAPTHMDATFKKHKVLFTWQAPTFLECSSSTPESYVLKIRTQKKNLVKNISNIETTEYSIPYASLPKNKILYAKVKAIAVDGADTDYSSLIRLATPPAKPKRIVVSNITNSTADLVWRNVKRAKRVKYYQVIVQEQSTGDTVFSTHVKSKYRKKFRHVTATHLEPNTLYIAKVRAVVSKKKKSIFTKTLFTTLR